MKLLQREAQIETTAGLTVYDITDGVREVVASSGVVAGICCVFSPHTTCCIRVNEFESGFLEDFANLLRRVAPADEYYAHDDLSRRTENLGPDAENANGHAHCMAMIMGTNGESIPIRDGELCLGTWQRVLFVELDRPRERRWIAKVVGT